VALLSAIANREITPVGGGQPASVDVRIIAATNRSLAAEVDAGRFREDLYYRLAVVRVSIPPLRERLEDVAMLVEHFAHEAAHRGQPPVHLPEATVRGFVAQAWPGNVRELRNAVKRAISLGVPSHDSGDAEPVPASLGTIDLDVPLKIARERMVDAFEELYLAEALKRTGGNVSRAADLAGVNRKFVQRAMKRLGLRDDDE